ncbi:MAG: VOC family protein [Saprospiraceae bacterium]|nr:VOC family protein [Saprospiraceae bacterium]
MQGLRTTIYKVGNMELAKDWYSKAFRQFPYFEEDYYVGFNIQGYELGLQPEEFPVSPKAETVIAYWGVEKIQEEYDRLLKVGASPHEPPTNVGGTIEVATVKDPWGNIIGLIYNPEFKAT